MGVCVIKVGKERHGKVGCVLSVSTSYLYFQSCYPASWVNNI